MTKIDGLIVVEPVRMTLPIHGMALKPIVLVTTDPEKAKVANTLKDGVLSIDGFVAAYVKPMHEAMEQAQRDEDARIIAKCNAWFAESEKLMEGVSND